MVTCGFSAEPMVKPTGKVGFSLFGKRKLPALLSVPFTSKGVWELRGRKHKFLVSVIAAFLFLASVPTGLGIQGAHAQEFYSSGSLPEIAKKVNQLIYPTFGNPVIVRRGDIFTIEWDWRLSDGTIPLSALPISDPGDWEVSLITSVAANVQSYNGYGTEKDFYWFRNEADPYGYGQYDDPVHTVRNTRKLKVLDVRREPSLRWPEVFGQEQFVVDRIDVEIPRSVPLDLYDIHVLFKGEIPGGYLDLIPPERRESIREDTQPHAVQVIKEYKNEIKVLQVSDIHVYGQEIQNAFGINYLSFVLREPRPGTPDRMLDEIHHALMPGYQDFPLDTDCDGVPNEGAMYLQEIIQAINLINPDFVVFTGDSVYGQKNWNTYPKDAWPWPGTPGDMGTEYRFEYTWFYDELLALNVPIYLAPGNHDGYCWDGHVDEGGVEHDDGLEIWQDLFGPVYYSWEYGDYLFFALNTMDWPKLDPAPVQEPRDRNGENILSYVTNPHKWHGQLRGNGDRWKEGDPPPGSGLRWDPKNPDDYSGQLGWLKRVLEANPDKTAKGIFMHHDPIQPSGSDPEMWAHPGLSDRHFLYLPAGEGEGSQSLVHLMKTYNVDFVATGHEHQDRIDGVPWYDGTGQVVSINSTAVEPGVGPEALIPAAQADFNGYRIIKIRDGEVVDWGFPGADNDPTRKWSVPGWENLGIGTATPENPYPNTWQMYQSSRPSIQWMEQDASPLRPPIIDGTGTFSTIELPGEIPLPLNEKGPFEDVTCKIKNAIDGSVGAELYLSDCRLEVPMRLKNNKTYYVVENGRIVEQYDTDTSERMLVIEADVPGSSGSWIVPVRVRVGGSDSLKPLIDSFSINGGAKTTDSLEVVVDFEAHDEGGAGVIAYRIANDRDEIANAEWMFYDGPTRLSWRLAGEDGSYGKKKVYLQVKDAAMPCNTSDIVEASIAYDVDGPPKGAIVINGGAETTSKREVELSIDASDASGVRFMKIGNMPDLSDGEWEQFKNKRSWTIAPDIEGLATVYAMFKDGADLESDIVSDSIIYRPGAKPEPEPEPELQPARTWYLAEGSTGRGDDGSFETWVLIQNPGSKTANVQITYMTPSGKVEGPSIELKPGTRQSVSVADTVENEWSVSTVVTSDVPVIAERAVYWNSSAGVFRQAAHDSIGVD